MSKHLALLLSTLFLALPLTASTGDPVFVNTLIDENNGPTPNLSLREAIILTSGDGRTICFDPSTSGDPIPLDTPIDIPPGDNVIIDASNLDCAPRIVGEGLAYIFQLTGSASLTLNGLVVEGADGSAIIATGTGTTANILCSRIRGNLSTAVRVEDFATLNAVDSEFYNNTSTDTLAPYKGGGIYTSNANININRCSFYHNTALNGGGLFLSGACTGSIANTTISENVSTGPGGGINANHSSGTVIITHSTITGNSGRGITHSSAGTLELGHSILAHNYGAGGSPANSSGTLTSKGYNLSNTAPSSLSSPNDILNTDPQLSLLSYNGGKVLTCFPRVDSPAIDAGQSPTPGGTPTLDARGFSRIVDGDNDTTATLDIGAVEVGPRVSVTNTNNSGAGSLRDALTTSSDGSRILFAPALSGTSINITSAISLNSNHLDLDASNLPFGVSIDSTTINSFLSLTGTASLSLHRLGIRDIVADVTAENLIYLDDQSALGLNSCLIARNLVTDNIIQAKGCSQLHIVDTEFFENAPRFTTNAHCVNSSEKNRTSLWKSSFIDNTSGDLGALTGTAAALLAGNGSFVEVRNTTFARNTAGDGGGAINANSLSRCSISFCTFQENYAADKGGACILPSTTTLTDSLFSCNSDADDGTIVNTSDIILNNTAPFTEDNWTTTLNPIGLPAANNTTNTDLLLSPLAYYGGTIRTAPPYATSPLTSTSTKLRALDARGLPGAIAGASDPGATQAQPAITVTNANGSGAGSLRQAILDADPGNRILFDSALSGQTIDVAPEIETDKDLIIDATLLPLGITLDGQGSNRILDLLPGSHLGLHALSFKEGVNLSQNGGGIRTEGHLCLSHSAVTDCGANYGGGLWLGSTTNYSTAVIQNTTFHQNQSEISGNAIGSNFGDLRITHSTIHDNDGLNGGGVNLLGAAHTAGLYLTNPATRLTLDHVILSENNTRPANGSGLRNGALTNSATALSLGYNLTDGPAAPFNIASDLTATNPILSTLQSLGGYALALPPLSASPALNAGDPINGPCPSLDQLGNPRIADGIIDIGAVESLITGTASLVILSVEKSGTDLLVEILADLGSNWNVEDSLHLDPVLDPFAVTGQSVTGTGASQIVTIPIVDLGLNRYFIRFAEQ